MTYVTNVLAVAVVAGFTALILKKKSPAFSLVLSVCAAVAVLLAVMQPLRMIVEFILGLSDTAGISNDYIKALLKITAISIVLKLILAIMHDSNNSTLEYGIEIGGRVCIILVALPFVADTINILINLLNIR
jgi:stage III sporulation protein AD